MATTTPNFGWSVPTSSDLVKNGATAIETLGDSIDASLVDLKGGTTGQVLAKASGTDMDFTWSTPAAGGGGKVLQVVQAVVNTQTEVATSTFTDTSLTASITPTLATSKILVMIQQASRVAISASENYAPLRLLRGSTVIFDTRGTTPQPYGGIGWGGTGPTTMAFTHFQPMIYLDSPATTSATTYKTQGNSYLTSSSGKVTYQWETMASTITLMEIGA
jgi:hypothetical protein